MSNLRSFTFVIDRIYKTAGQFDIPSGILDKIVIDKLASLFQKTYIKEKQLVNNSLILCSPQLFVIVTKTRREVSYEQPIQLKAVISALRRFSRAFTRQFIYFLEKNSLIFTIRNSKL